MFNARHAGLKLGLLLLFLGGCTAPQTRVLLQQPSGLPDKHTIPDVPFYPQEKYYCGPASLAMMLNWAGSPADQQEIASQIYTPGRQGTLPIDILGGARRNGALAVEVKSLQDLIAEIAAGNPVLVFQNLGLKFIPKWHFAVATGYDLNKEHLLLHSGLDPQRITDLHAFEKTWQRADYWAVTVTPPDHLPEKATELAVLKAASGLEHAEHYDAAITAYKTIARRWPMSFIAQMGLGNTEYKRGNLAAAATAFHKASLIDNSNPAAWNNLANALAGQGLYDEALAAAQKAIMHSNMDDSLYQTTLEEITQLKETRDRK